MKLFIFVLVLLIGTICQAKSVGKQKRLACAAGELGCAALCASHFHFNGGCCGQQGTKCDGTCYCNGSGLEHRCHTCNIH
uniref:Uncharacterized protein n=1 Tax=Pinctada fucata TaxID=50426 RepID=A0A194AL40_PINFU